MKDWSRRAGARIAAFVLLAALGCATGGGPPEERSSNDQAKARAHYRLGVENLKEGHAALAIRDLQASVQYDPDDRWSQLALAEAYRQKGHPKMAEDHLRRALSIDPSFQQARLNLSALYIQQERYEEAIVEVDRLLDDPTFPVPWKALTNRGWAELQLGKVAEARRSLELALEYHATYWQAFLNLGILAEKEGDRLEALERFEQVLAAKPGPFAEAEANYRIAEIYIALGNRDRAVRHLTAAASSHPSGPWGKRSEDYLERLR